MIENKLIPTNTEVTSKEGVLSVFTYFTAAIESITAFISQLKQSVGGKSFKEGELGIIQNGYEDITFFIDLNGNLIIQSKSDKNFYLNSNGELIMEEPS